MLDEGISDSKRERLLRAATNGLALNRKNGYVVDRMLLSGVRASEYNRGIE